MWKIYKNGEMNSGKKFRDKLVSMKPKFFGNFANEQRNNAHKRVSITTKMEANTLFDIKTFNLLYISHHFTLTKHYQYCE